MRLDSFKEQSGWNRMNWFGVAAESGRAASLLRRCWPSLAVSLFVLFGYGCAQSAAAQAINLGPQVKGVLPVGNGGFGLDTEGLTGCPAENNGVWTVSAANCATAGSGVSAIDGPSGTTTGTVYLTGSAVSQSGNTFTITNSGGTLTTFDTGSWPSWLTPTVTTATTTPTLGVSASAIPDAALAGPLVNEVTGPSSTVNGDITLTGSGVSQSGNTFTFNGACASGTCVQANAATSQTVSQTNSSFGVTVNNNSTTLATPLNNMALSLYSSGPGYYVNNGPWGGHTGIDINFLNNSPGIDHGITGNFTDLKVGDAAWQYAYLLFYGGTYFGSDEGLQAIDIKPQQVGYFQGNLTTPSAGNMYEPSNPSVATASGYTQLFDWNGMTFTGSGVLSSVTIGFSTSQVPTAQTDYIVIWTPGTGNNATINAVLPVSVTATGGTQTFTSASFGTVNIVPGEGIGFYAPAGYGAEQVSSEPGLCSTVTGTPVVGPITTVGDTDYSQCGGSRGVVMEAYLAPPTTGSTTLAVNNFECWSHAQGCLGQSGWEWATGGILLDMQNATPTTATFISGADVLGDMAFNLGSAAVTESTAWGTVSSCSPNTTNENNQVANSDTCQITLGTSPASPGNFVAGEDACIAGWYQEEVPITSVGTTSSGVQAVTFTTFHNYGSGAVIMQGGPCGQFVVNNNSIVSGSQYFWPVAFQVLGATSTTQILLANCVTGSCTDGALTPNPELLYSGLQNYYPVSLTRTNNVVSVNFNDGATMGGGGVYSYPVGSTINVAGCTVDTDLIGTYTITANSEDALNPTLQWAQTGSNEGPDTTCTVNSGYPEFTFYPGAFINSSASASAVNVQPNQVPWNSGDLIREAPASTYSENDIVDTHGQSSMPYNSEAMLTLQDLGPAWVNSNITVTNNATGANGPGGTMLYANGGWVEDISLAYPPQHNGCIICTRYANPGTGSYPPPYYLFSAGGGGTIEMDTVNGDFAFGDPISAPVVEGVTRLSFANNVNSGLLHILQENPGPGGCSGCVASEGDLAFWNGGATTQMDIIPSSSSAPTNVFKINSATGQMNLPVTPTVNSTPVVVANDSTLTVSSATLAANTCSTAASVTINGVTTSGAGSHISSGYTSDPAALTGWGAVGGMVFHIWPSAANTAEWEVCNQTSAAIVYSAITFSIGVE